MNAHLKIKRPLIRYHGGKFRLAPWLMQFFPPHRIYCEPYGGAASVMLLKEKAYAEVYNDLDGDIVNIFRVLQSEKASKRLIELIELTPFARTEFELAWLPTEDAIERARRTIIRAQMGFGSCGATKGTTGFRSDTSRRYTTAQMDWLKYPDCLPPIIERFKSVVIENRPAIQVINNQDSEETLFYIDPPYMHETRVMKSKGYYQFEMNDEQHIELLDVIKKIKGFVVLNGYSSPLYESHLAGWKRFQTFSRASAFRGSVLRTEVVWLNQACHQALKQVQGSLFQN